MALCHSPERTSSSAVLFWQRGPAPRGAARELRLTVASLADVDAEVVANRLAPRVNVAKLPDSALPLTLPSRYCPSDKLEQRAKAIERD